MTYPSFLCIVFDKNGNLLGTGSVISRSPSQLLVLTAGHVIRASLGDDALLLPEAIRLCFIVNGTVSNKEKCHSIVASSLPTPTNGFLDYALLRVAIKSSTVVAVSPKLLSNPSTVNLDLEGWGAFNHSPDSVKLRKYSALLEGSEAFLNRPEVFHYSLKGAFPADKGYSGGPLIIMQKNKPQVIAILSQREEPAVGIVGQDALELKMYGTPIFRIARAIPNWDKLINPPPFWINYECLRLFGLPGISKKRNRDCLALNHEEEDTFENDVSRIVDGQLNTAMKNVSSTLFQCKSWVDPKVLRNPIICEGIIIRPVSEENRHSWESALEKDITSDQRNDLRFIIECNTGLPVSKWEMLPLSNSHGLVVALAKGDEKEDYNTGFARIEDHEVENAAKKVLRLIEDLFLDINVFHGNSILSGLFASTHSRKFFDQEKRAFLRHKGYPHHRTLARAARTLPAEPIDVDSYHELWKEFLECWLLPEAVENVGVSREVRLEPEDAETLDRAMARAFEGVPALAGQMGTRRLTVAYRKFLLRHPAHLSGRFYLAIFIKRPKEKQVRQRMEFLFESGSLHLKRVAFFTHDELACNLLNSLAYVQILTVDATVVPR